MSTLLVLQSRDRDLRESRQRLDNYPKEQERLDREEAEAEARRTAARDELRAAEVKRQGLSQEAEEARTKIQRLRNQQLEVRKNEEYQALNHEIAALEERIDGVETEEIDLLDTIAEREETLRSVGEEVDRERERLQRERERLAQHEAEARAQIGEREEGVTAARAAVPADLFQRYEGLLAQKKRFPVVVPLEGQVCQGCHLRVSNEVAGAVRDFEVVACDQCGRLLFQE